MSHSQSRTQSGKSLWGKSKIKAKATLRNLDTFAKKKHYSKCEQLSKDSIQPPTKKKFHIKTQQGCDASTDFFFSLCDWRKQQ